MLIKKIVLHFVCAFVVCGAGFASGFETKGNIFLGVNPVSSSYDSKEKETNTDFDSAYLEAYVATSNDYVTVGGKFYYRLSMYDDSKDVDSSKTLAQKIDVKRAYARIRPFGSELLEISGGKLYSYYLPGNFFSLSEIYTGSSRWGKTGVGAKFQKNGFTVGAAIPVTESYVEFSNSWGINWALGYDFGSINEKLPLKIGASWLYEYDSSESKDKNDPLKINSEESKEFRYTLSANYASRLSGFISKLNTTLSYSWNASSYISSSTFKNVANYSSVGDAWFFSLNHKNNFGNVEMVLESEIGNCIDETIVPVYAGIQFLIPIFEHVAFKPRFYYFGAHDTDDSDESRQTFEWYPRLWLTFGNWIVSAGCDFDYKQIDKSDWQWEWNIPMYVEYRFNEKK